MDALEQVWTLMSREIYGLALFRSGNAEDAADIVQDLFFHLGERAMTLADVRKPRVWLLTVTHRRAIDLLRRRRRRRSRPVEECEGLLEPILPAADRADAATASALLRRLPSRQREVLFLRFFAEMSFREIGETTGVATFTAASRYRLAIRKLRRFMRVEE